MPSLQQLPDLASLETLSPYLNQAGMQQIGMANQFNQMGLKQGQADLEQQTLRNMFDTANNPQKLEAGRLANEGAGLENILRGVESRTASANEDVNKEAKRAKALAEMDDNKLRKLQAQAETYLMEAARDGDNDKASKAQRMLDGSWGEIQRRRKAADDLAKAQAMGDNRMRVVEAQQSGANERNQANISARQQAVAARAQGGKQPNENFQQAATRAMREMNSAQDPAERAAKQEEVMYWLQQEQNRQLASGVGKVDVGQAANVPTVQAPKIVAPPSRSVSGPVSPGPAAQPGVTGNFVGNLEQAARDIQNIKDPQERANAAKALEDQVNGRRTPAPQSPAQTSLPPVPPKPGKIAIYKDGKPVGYVPEGQRQQALDAGYQIN